MVALAQFFVGVCLKTQSLLAPKLNGKLHLLSQFEFEYPINLIIAEFFKFVEYGRLYLVPKKSFEDFLHLNSTIMIFRGIAVNDSTPFVEHKPLQMGLFMR